MRSSSLIAALAMMMTLAAPLAAQRARDAEPLPAVLTVTPTSPYRATLSIEARESVEIAADRRLLRVEGRDARGRRFTCSAPDAPRIASRVVALSAGERWSEWLDLREICWGRSLAAMVDAREVSFRFDAGRARGAWVARTPRASVRALAPVVSSIRTPAASPAPAGRVTIALAPSDGVRGGRPTFRVEIRGGADGPVRVFVRPGHVSFLMTAPSGRTVRCRGVPFAGRALPDFFTRLTSRRAIVLALDAAAYCGPLEEPGLYEVTPILTLSEAGEAWDLEAVTGTFRGAPAPLRLRSATYVEQPVEERAR